MTAFNIGRPAVREALMAPQNKGRDRDGKWTPSGQCRNILLRLGEYGRSDCESASGSQRRSSSSSETGMNPDSGPDLGLLPGFQHEIGEDESNCIRLGCFLSSLKSIAIVHVECGAISMV
jgi:hypothetical protein